MFTLTKSFQAWGCSNKCGYAYEVSTITWSMYCNIALAITGSLITVPVLVKIGFDWQMYIALFFIQYIFAFLSASIANRIFTQKRPKSNFKCPACGARLHFAGNYFKTGYELKIQKEHVVAIGFFAMFNGVELLFLITGA